MRVFPYFSVFVLLSGLAFGDSSSPFRVVQLRIEGANSTIFEGPIITRGHNVTTISGGNHHCDGTNLGANSRPDATCTTALNDAGKLANFTFDATFFEEFDDFFITRISSSEQTDTQFWGILLNFVFTPVGGCQQQVKTLDDHVLWAFDAFNAEHFLKLDGPHVVRAGTAATFTVVDGLNNTNIPVAGASVYGATTDPSGHIVLTFPTKGLHSLKATKTASIRSNRLDVLVF